MSSGQQITYFVALAAGVLTFLSPCLLPLIPAFIAYLTGVSAGDDKNTARWKAAKHSFAFILGFSIVFILLGLTATAIGKTLFKYQGVIRIIGGVLITLFGLHLVGILKADFLGKERRIHLTTRSASFLGSFLVGVTFAAAWTPCAGPILGSILVIAGTKATFAEGAILLTAYSMGIAIPFFITGLLVNYFMEFFNRFRKIVNGINVAGGIFLIIIGVLVATDYLNVIGAKLTMLFMR